MAAAMGVASGLFHRDSNHGARRRCYLYPLHEYANDGPLNGRLPEPVPVFDGGFDVTTLQERHVQPPAQVIVQFKWRRSPTLSYPIPDRARHVAVLNAEIEDF